LLLRLRRESRGPQKENQYRYSDDQSRSAQGDSREVRAEQFAAFVRIAIFIGSSKDFFRLASDIQNPLGRVCAYGVVGALTVAAVVGCASIRHHEAQFEAQYPERLT
jgi:hypothetical protein